MSDRDDERADVVAFLRTLADEASTEDDTVTLTLLADEIEAGGHEGYGERWRTREGGEA